MDVYDVLALSLEEGHSALNENDYKSVIVPSSYKSLVLAA